jgi:hypothetical protein
MRGRDLRRKLVGCKLLFLNDLAGRQGFELGAGPVSNMVMARDFWLQALEAQAVTSLRFVHCRLLESSTLCPRRGDILETVIEPVLFHDSADPSVRPASAFTTARSTTYVLGVNCNHVTGKYPKELARRTGRFPQPPHQCCLTAVQNHICRRPSTRHAL